MKHPFVISLVAAVVIVSCARHGEAQPNEATEDVLLSLLTRMLLDREQESLHTRASMTGTVKWFNEAKGYGFIAPDDKSADVFVHYTAIQVSGFRTLSEGQRVSFEVENGPKGRSASNIVPLI
ncbi:unnamed protein product [Owenia fusiformis]|nr:unnamed protein product [Owenia fusiformis]